MSLSVAEALAPVDMADTDVDADIACTRFLQDPGRRFSVSPIGGAAQPDEIATAILFLTSADVSFVNDAMTPVDGGLTARRF